LIGNGAVSLTNVTVAGNTASVVGGGLSVRGAAALTLANATVNGNTAVSGLGGLDTNSTSVTPTINNSIVAGHSSLFFGPFTGSHNLINAAPLLGHLGDYGGPTPTMPLLPGSPAIGGGTAAGAPAKDQRGVARSGHVDIGAFQSEGFTLTPV